MYTAGPPRVERSSEESTPATYDLTEAKSASCRTKVAGEAASRAAAAGPSHSAEDEAAGEAASREAGAGSHSAEEAVAGGGLGGAARRGLYPDAEATWSDNPAAARSMPMAICCSSAVIICSLPITRTTRVQPGRIGRHVARISSSSSAVRPSAASAPWRAPGSASKAAGSDRKLAKLFQTSANPSRPAVSSPVLALTS